MRALIQSMRHWMANQPHHVFDNGSSDNVDRIATGGRLDLGSLYVRSESGDGRNIDKSFFLK